jgi:hypothetical protein
MECVSCRSCCTITVLHKQTNTNSVVGNWCDRKRVRCRKWSIKYLSFQLMHLSSLGSSILYLWHILDFKVDIASLIWIALKRFPNFLSYFLNSHDILKPRYPSIWPSQKQVLFRHVQETRRKDISFALYLGTFHFLYIFLCSSVNKEIPWGKCDV